MSATPGTPDVDVLVAELKALVESRRAEGFYPDGLEQDLATHFETMMARGLRAKGPTDLRAALNRVQAALPLEAERIQTTSRHAAGSALHQTVAKLVHRQTEGALQQVQGFAQPVTEALEALALLYRDLAGEIRDDLSARLDAVVERQAAYERWIAQSGPAPDEQPPASRSLSDAEIQQRRDELTTRVRDCEPVLVLTDDLTPLRTSGDGSLGALVLVDLVEALTPRQVVEFTGLAATQLRAGGRLLVDTTNPRAVLADATGLDPDAVQPLHPAYLTFLLIEAGFSQATIEWREPPDRSPTALSRNLYAPGDHTVVAVR